MKVSLSKLAEKFNLKLDGNGSLIISGVAPLNKANKNQLSFLANSKYTSQLKDSNAGVIIVSESMKADYQGNKLIANDPYVAFAKVASLFQNSNQSFTGIHETAVIAKSAQVEKGVTIGPFSIIGENSIIQSGTVLEARATIGNNCKIGSDCLIKANVVVSYNCSIGNRVIIHPGAIIGADGFGLAREDKGWIKVPQLGAVKIGNDCEIGANTTIDRGTMEDTILEDDVRLDNQIQIAHNVFIGKHTVMAGCSAVAGSAKIGKNCLIGGGVGIIGHLEVCDGVTLQSMALVTRSIKRPGSYSSVAPIQETHEWRKSAVRIKQLDKIAKRVAILEKKIRE
ncbi:MAG: UDP-3-O-(3-hydroxymyristoyl)glucosamine N-acyltransferase [Marinicellaceae bacterium]